MRYAEELVREEKFEEALKEFLYCYDHGYDQDPAFSGVRNSFLLNHIQRLGRKLPAAIQALESRRDTLDGKINSKQATRRDLMDYAALNRTLRVPQKTLDLYDSLDALDPNRKSLYHSVFPLLLEKKRYQDIEDANDLAVMVSREFQSYQRMKQFQMESLGPERTRP